ncbi:MAG TPA: choice-of-anchor Q domain-containing protein, partial [Anaerolineales bacterium]|nr:choice-of-anchor Q domain-containing protein [Anaerolineales bacterium]
MCNDQINPRRSRFIIIFALIGALLMQNLVQPKAAYAQGATLIVNSTTTGGTHNSFCSLYEAIYNANMNTNSYTECGAGSNTGSDTISFDFSLANAIISSAGLPIISDPAGLTIIGLPYLDGGDLGVTISGGDANRLFYTSAPLVLDSLILANGKANFGGGIYAEGNLTIINSIVRDNHANTQPSNNLGGAIYANSNVTLTVSNSVFSNNGVVGGGGGIYFTSGTADISNTSFTGNGNSAVYNINGTVNITNSYFTSNPSSFFGGGIFSEGGTLNVDTSTFTSNTASTGGAIYNFSASVLNLKRSTFKDNIAFGDGGAVWNNTLSASISNSTFTGNSANSGVGGGVDNTGSMTIINSTFTANTASVSGGDIYDNNLLYLHNSILANNTTGGNCVSGSATPVTGTYNLIEGSSACGLTNNTNGNIVDVSDPNLGTATGVPAYFPLNSDSPAIDAADANLCAQSPVSNLSQNGVSRTASGICDMGSYEKPDLAAPTVSSIVRASANPVSASSVDFTVNFSEAVTGVEGGDFFLTVTGLTGAAISNVSGSGSTRTVSVNTGTGTGSLRLDVPNTASIKDLAGNDISGLPFQSGETYTVNRNAPTNITLSNASISEHLPTATVIGSFSTTDPDAGNTFTYSLVSGSGSDDNAAFIVLGGELRTGQAFNFAIKSNYSIRIRTTGNDGLFFEKAFTISVMDVNIFNDVPASYWANAFIERLYIAGITGGCGNSPLIYCPENPVTRAQMAVFLEKALHGSAFIPPNVPAT